MFRQKGDMKAYCSAALAGQLGEQSKKQVEMYTALALKAEEKDPGFEALMRSAINRISSKYSRGFARALGVPMRHYHVKFGFTCEKGATVPTQKIRVRGMRRL